MKKTIRHIACDILDSVSRSHVFAGDLLDAALDQHHLSGIADGRLLTHLVYGVLRMRGHLDWILARLYRGDYDKMDDSVKNILRTGLYQLRFSERLPAFAVVDEAVKIAKKIAPASDGLINAVLRNYLRNTDQIPFPSLDKNSAEHIAAFHSHPLWLVQLWLTFLSQEETLALCQANNELPPLTLRVNALKISREEMEKKFNAEGFICSPTQFSPHGINIHNPPRPVHRTTFFKEGLFRLQDEAAQLVSCLVNPQSDESVLDVCSGSGGKTTHLASLMRNNGRIAALDRNQDKIGQLNQEALRLGVSILEGTQADLNSPLPAGFAENFDHVLVDAPCSGTGTLRRNPEIKWRLNAPDVDALSETQKNILSNASAAVKKTGYLIYSTCSVLPAENDEVIRQFLTDHTEFIVSKPSTKIADNLMDSHGFFRTYPHRHHMDGFFGAILRRRI